MFGELSKSPSGVRSGGYLNFSNRIVQTALRRLGEQASDEECINVGNEIFVVELRCSCPDVLRDP